MSYGPPESRLVEEVNRLFARGGPLASAFGGAYELREEQAKLAADYARAIFAPPPDAGKGGKIGVIEAATGMGKTVAYLAALALNTAISNPPQRALISTRTRALQRQIVDDGDGEIVLRAVREMTKTDITLARQIGRGNYLDRARIRRAAKELRDENDPRADRLKEIAECGAKTFDELRVRFELDPPAGIVTADLCVTPASADDDAADYLQDRKRAANADIVVINHALALADARLRGKVISADRNVGLFDEADALPDQARAMSDERVHPETLMQIADKLPDEAAKKIRPVLDELARLARNATRDAERVVNPGGELPESVRDAAEKIAETARRLTVAHSDIRDELRDAAAVLKHWTKAARDRNPNFAATVIPAPVRSRPAFSLCALQPAFVISRLWRDGAPDDPESPPLLRAVVLTSATLSEPLLPALGIGAGPAQHRRSHLVFPEIKRREPRRFGEIKLILADPAVPRPYARAEDNHESAPPEINPEFLRYAADGIRKAGESGGRVLVLANSFHFAETLGEKIPDASIHKRGQPLEPLLEKFRAEKSAVLITPSAWEGVDLPGLVDNLVVPAVPHPPWPMDFLAALEEKFNAAGKSPESAKTIVRLQNADHAVRKLKQGIGRAIRKADDRCVVWILDPRFPRPGRKQKNNLANALPDRFKKGPRAPFRPAGANAAKLFAKDGGVRPLPVIEE